MMERTVVIRSAAAAEAACRMLMENWPAMAQSDQPLAVRFYPYKAQRTLEQQALMWLRLGEIAEQVLVEQVRFSDEVWHEHFKQRLLPDEIGPTKRCRTGYRKWAFTPDGRRVMVGSTTGLTVFGMAEYITQLEAEGAQMGVRFSAVPEGQR